MWAIIIIIAQEAFVSFYWLSILFITRFMTLQGAVYVGALLASSGPIIRFFKRPLFFSFSFFLFFTLNFPACCAARAFVVIFVYVNLIRHMTKILVNWFFLLSWKILENQTWEFNPAWIEWASIRKSWESIYTIRHWWRRSNNLKVKNHGIFFEGNMEQKKKLTLQLQTALAWKIL
jgi:hypothetical protein